MTIQHLQSAMKNATMASILVLLNVIQLETLKDVLAVMFSLVGNAQVAPILRQIHALKFVVTVTTTMKIVMMEISTMMMAAVKHAQSRTAFILLIWMELMPGM